MSDYRKLTAKQVRDAASQMAYDRDHPSHQSNGDEQRFANAKYAMSFTKGLEHDKKTGLIKNASDFKAFRAAIDNGTVDAFTTSVPSAVEKKRAWEAPTAGLVYDLQGPDSHAVTMPPAPALGSKELAYEMAEVYELALLRDVPLSEFEGNTKGCRWGSPIVQSLSRLNAISYDVSGSDGRKRKHDGKGNVIGQTVFRGSSPGVEKGPYLSQFLLLGNKSVAGEGKVTYGKISYGALSVDQRVPVALPEKNFMTDEDSWLNAQNGADLQGGKEAELFGPSGSVKRRFISTPRDLATYVHYDALYEAYLNACLILLGMKAPSDPGFDHLSGSGCLHLKGSGAHEREAGGFALWGGPHILTLVTEVATRALKAVRYQKFNIHCRLRPEALAGRIHKATAIESDFPAIGTAFSDLEAAIQSTVAKVNTSNRSSTSPSGTKLLPMAFQEGSPMHPSYGAGHATVAGACVTILKAYFDTSAVLVKRQYSDARDDDIMFTTKPLKGEPVKIACDGTKDSVTATDSPIAFVSDFDPNDCAKDGTTLDDITVDSYLTLEGELNKLAANISIGRNMAGVHYFSDYYDSLRMGEAIAIGILEEQALCYAQEPFVLSVPTFDGAIRRIGAR